MYKRILVKLSGEALKGKEDSILYVDYLKHTAQELKVLHDKGIQVAVVIGAGNIWRGKLANDIGIERVPADYMGMLGTVINAVAVSSALKNLGVSSVVLSALPPIDGVTEAYDKEVAKKALNENKIVFLAGGTGKPFYTTDTGAALRAIEIEAEAILMGKNGVDGVYDSDPIKNKDAKFLKNLTFDEILKLNLQVMDRSAVELLLDKDIVIRVFSMAELSNFEKVCDGEDIGTTCKRG